MKFFLGMMATLISGSLVACDADAISDSASNCDEATSEMQDCMAKLGQEGFSPAECEALVDNTSRLCSADKADGFGGWMCEAGALSYCEVPLCNAPSVVSSGVCDDYIGVDGCASCDYYLCKEANENTCGNDGYFVGFGHKYCERLTLVTEPRLSAAGQAWSAATRECLMIALERDSSPSDSCDEIQTIAFDSHPDCYVDKGFCDLPISDIFSVVMTIDSEDYQLRQLLGVGVGCLSEWL